MSGAGGGPLLQVGRLKAREEGPWWVFRYEISADTEVELGRVHMATVDAPARREQALDLFREISADIIQAATGIRPTFGGEQPAPEHERAGHG